MKNEKFARVYDKYSDLVLRILLNGCQDEDAAQEMCLKVFQGYYVRMDMLGEELIRPWLIWFSERTVNDYRKEHGMRTKSRESQMESMKKDRPPRSSESIQNLLDSMARNHKEKSVLEDLREENEDWCKMVYLAAHFHLTEEEIAEHMKISPMEACIQLFEAKQYLVYKYLDELRMEYKKGRSESNA